MERRRAHSTWLQDLFRVKTEKTSQRMHKSATLDHQFYEKWRFERVRLRERHIGDNSHGLAQL